MKKLRIITEIVIVTAISQIVFSIVETGDFVRDILVMAIIVGLLAFLFGVLEFYVKSRK